MCAIVDANIAAEVFRPDRPQAGKKFFDWIHTGSGRLVVGGKLLKELDKSSRGFRQWAKVAGLSGRMRTADQSQVDARAEELRGEKKYRSNDPHIIALAQVSGARLLYSNDGKLQQDFKDKNMINSPRGKVYSTHESKNFSVSHKQLLEKKDLCRVEQ